MGIAGTRSPDLAGLKSNLGVTYEHLYQQGDYSALGRALAAHASAAATVPRDYPARATVLSNFGGALLDQFRACRDDRVLSQARSVLLDAVASCPPQHSDRGVILHNAAVALSFDFDSADLTRALSLCDEAAGIEGISGPLTADIATLRGQLQHRLADLTGERRALEFAVENLEIAVRLAVWHRGDVADARTALASALKAKAERYGRLADLSRAIEEIALARAETPNAARLSSHHRTGILAVALSTRFQWTFDVADIDSAIEMFEALAVEDQHGSGRHRANLAVCLTQRADTEQARPSDLDRAVNILRDLTQRPTDLPQDAALSAALADALLDRAQATGSDRDLQEAHAAASAAVANTSDDTPQMTHRLGILGEAYLDRFQARGHPEDLEAALRAFSRAFDIESAPTHARVRAALLWAHCAASGARWSEALRAHDLGQALVPRLLSHDLQPRDGLRLVEDLAEAGPDAVALSLAEDRPSLGLIRSEQWRALVLGPDRTRRRMWTLLLAEHPDLGARLQAAGERLAGPEVPDNDLGGD